MRCTYYGLPISGPFPGPQDLVAKTFDDIGRLNIRALQCARVAVHGGHEVFVAEVLIAPFAQNGGVCGILSRVHGTPGERDTSIWAVVWKAAMSQ